MKKKKSQGTMRESSLMEMMSKSRRDTMKNKSSLNQLGSHQVDLLIHQELEISQSQD